MYRSEASVYNSYFFQNRRLTEIQYTTLDSHTNTVISPFVYGGSTLCCIC